MFQSNSSLLIATLKIYVSFCAQYTCPALLNEENNFFIKEIEPMKQTSKFCTYLIHCFEKFGQKDFGSVSVNTGSVHAQDLFSNCSL